MTIDPVSNPTLQLYESLEKACPKELAKLQKADEKDKPKILNAIAKKVLLKSKTNKETSEINFKQKTFG